MGKEGVKIEIMDTTLRDGEQTSGAQHTGQQRPQPGLSRPL